MDDCIKKHEVQWTLEKNKAIWGHYVTDSDLKGVFYPADFYKEILQKVKRYLKSNIRCLDMGCGIGTLRL